MRRTPAAVAAALLAAALLGGCSDVEGATAARAPSAGSTSTPSATASLPQEPAPAPGDLDDPELESALSEPVEDSVYPDVGDPGVDSLRYDLDLAWTPDTRTLVAEATIELRSTSDSDHLQLDLAEALEVDAVSLDGTAVDFEHEGKDLVVAAPVREDQRYVLEVSYSGTPEPTQAPTTRGDFNTTGWTTTAAGEVWTMQEPYGAFTWYPVNDQPSDKALYDISVTAPAPWVGVANGELVDQTEQDGLTTTSWHLSSPASSYLVTVAIGDYERTSNTSASGVEISYWVPADRPGVAEQLEYAATGLDWLEGILGPYPFDSLGFLLVDSRSGMETQTMITLGLTEYSTSRAVLVHEMAHQWYGDAVTPDDWRDVWMNEGMAMYLQGMWQADADDRSIDELMDEWASFEPDLREESGPPAAYDPTQFGEANVYYCPAVMWHELRKRIGDERFFQVVRDWPALDPESNAGRDDYVPWLVEQTGVEREFFDAWLLGATSPSRVPSSSASG